MKNMKEMLSVTAQSDYNRNFWDAMRLVPDAAGKITGALETGSVSYLPADSEKKFRETMSGIGVIRKLATIQKKYSGTSAVWAYESDDYATFVDDGEAIPNFNVKDDFRKIRVDSFKMAVLAKTSTEFISDPGFDAESYITKRMAKSFAMTEDKTFINGTGTGEPTGILHNTLGAQTAVTTDTLAYDNCIELFFSVKPEYRKNAVWMMNDRTALALRKLKDGDGNYLWNGENDTILGKPVIISSEMPDAEDGNKPVLFGDLSYYWIIDRAPISIKAVKELFAATDQVGYLGYERLDGKLIRSEAVKVIAISEEE